MHKPVAIAANTELVNPRSAEYAAFFDLIRAEGYRTAPLEGELHRWDLAEYGALLVGAPTQWRQHFEVAAVHKWVAEGGSLLLLASLGGDEIPSGMRHESSNLFQLVPGVRPYCDCLGVFEGKGTGQNDFPVWNFQRHVPVDVSALLGRSATLVYNNGCTLGLDKAPNPTPTGVTRAQTGWNFTSAPVEVLQTLPVPPGLHTIPAPVFDNYEPMLYSYDPTPASAEGQLFVRLRHGKGTVCVFGAAQSLTREGLAMDDTRLFAQWLLSVWLPEHARSEVRARKARPQRHRLLHGYPMAPLMPAIEPAARDELAAFEAAPPRADAGLIVGVLPHPFCNPAVRGCGFCTFPHEVFSHAAAQDITRRVCAELAAFRARAPELCTQPVTSVYLGGGTANLTPLDAMEALGASLSSAFNLAGAEVTLEGVPVYFHARRGALLDTFERAFPARHRRLSMGIQTFDDAQLARMGRKAFGDRALFGEVLRDAHRRGMTASCDLLFDLPGQSLRNMAADVDAAVDLGFDHVCLYHLVLFEGLGTEWSHDRSLLAKLPDNRRACDHWNELRDRLLARGFVQTSLTNFERADVNASDQRFRYEPCAYAPESYDLLGFGPTAISLRFRPDRAVKLLNADGSADYSRAVDSGAPRARAFVYDARDARVLYLTRKVVTLRIDRAEYRGLFASDPLADFAQEFEALAFDRLVTVKPDAIELTPKGMFYADTVAGLLAWRKVHEAKVDKVLALGRIPRPRASPVYDVNDSNFDAMG